MSSIPSNPNVLRMLDCCEVVALRGTRLCIVMPLAKGGDLMDFVLKRKPNEALAKAIFKQIVQGVHMVHSVDWCHRDLKLDNVLILDPLPQSLGVTAPSVTLADFGLASPSNATGPVGSPLTRAPEVFASSQYEGRRADVWSLGVILFNLLVHTDVRWKDPRYPYGPVARLSEATPTNAAFRILKTCGRPLLVDAKNRPLSRDFRSEESLDLVFRLLHPDAALRPTTQDILSHPWLQN